MISKERLEKLIEQGITIYEVKYGKINSVSLKNKIRFISKKYPVIVFEPRPNEKYKHHKYFDKLFETLEEAEWHRDFGCIERTERLNLPTWEEVCDGANHNMPFTTPKGQKVEMIICYEHIDIVSIYQSIIDFSKPLTKENYTIACRRCKELFLGEKE